MAQRPLLSPITAGANSTAHQLRWTHFQKWSTKLDLRSRFTLTAESDEAATLSQLSLSEPRQSGSDAQSSGPSQQEENQVSQGYYFYSRQTLRRSWRSRVDGLYRR